MVSTKSKLLSCCMGEYKPKQRKDQKIADYFFANLLVLFTEPQASNQPRVKDISVYSLDCKGCQH